MSYLKLSDLEFLIQQPRPFQYYSTGRIEPEPEPEPES